jgi:hypothetical protein
MKRVKTVLGFRTCMRASHPISNGPSSQGIVMKTSGKGCGFKTYKLASAMGKLESDMMQSAFVPAATLPPGKVQSLRSDPSALLLNCGASR